MNLVTIDTASTNMSLYIASNNASALIIGNTNCPITTLGLLNASSNISTPSIDVSARGTLNIGTNASSIIIGSANCSTKIGLLIGTNVSTTNLSASNSSLTTLVGTNISVTNISGNNASFNNMSFVTIANTSTIITGNLINVSNVSVTNASVNTLVIGSNVTTNNIDVSAAGTLAIAPSQTSGVLNIGTGARTTAGTINIGTGAGATALPISIGGTGSTLTNNGIFTSAGMINANNGITMGTGKNITLQPASGYVAPTALTMLGGITAGSFSASSLTNNGWTSSNSFNITAGTYIFFINISPTPGLTSTAVFNNALITITSTTGSGGTQYFSYYDAISRPSMTFGTASTYLTNYLYSNIFVLSSSQTLYLNIKPSFTAGGSGVAPVVTTSDGVNFIRIA